MYRGLKERSLVLVKPDGVKRGLAGEIIHRFEKAGLKLIALKMVRPTKAHAKGHYPQTKEFLTNMGKKTLANYEKYGLDPLKELGTKDPLEIGKMIAEWNVEYLTSGPLLAIVFEGNHAVDNIRMICGNTLPVKAQPGTIRGDFSVDSPALANAQKRALRNIVHASGTPEEADKEIAYWFAPEEIHSYRRSEEEVMFGKG